MMRQRGFTLIELAVVLVILTILAGGLLMPIASRVKTNQINEARRYLAEVNEALVGFAIRHERLPCPSSDEDGVADTCSPREGFLPYRTLGVAPTDPWGHTLRYRVGLDGTGNMTVSISPTTEGDIEVRERRAIDKTLQTLNSQAVAVVYSLGPNGSAPIPAANVDETENATATANNVLVTRVVTEAAGSCSDTDATPGVPLCEFDDQLIWLDANFLRGRLSAAGINLTD